MYENEFQFNSSIKLQLTSIYDRTGDNNLLYNFIILRQELNRSKNQSRAVFFCQKYVVPEVSTGLGAKMTVILNLNYFEPFWYFQVMQPALQRCIEGSNLRFIV